MIKQKTTKRALAASGIALVLCFAMLLGATYAWFTDSVESGANRIVAGNLDVELYHKSASVTADNQSVAAATDLFLDKYGNQMLWEPGAVTYETFTVKNVGSLAFKYNMKLNIADFNYTTLAAVDYDLRTPLKVKILSGTEKLATITRETVAALDWTTAGAYVSLEGFNKTGEKLYPVGNVPAGGASEEEFQVIVYWDPTDEDNNWNVNNGRTTSDGNPLFIDFGIYLVATQLEHESDSFDNQYDATATYPAFPTTVGGSGTSSFSKKTEDGGASTTMQKVEGGVANNVTDVATDSVSIEVKTASSSTIGTATVPTAAAEAILNDIAAATTSNYVNDDLLLTLNVETTESTDSSITLDVTMNSQYTRTEGASEAEAIVTQSVENNVTELTQPVTVTLNLEPGLQKVNVTHTHGTTTTPMTAAASLAAVQNGQYFYDPATGVLTLKTSQFSKFAISFTRANVVENTTKNTLHSSLTAASADASAGDVLQLNAAVSEGTISKAVTLDLNGKSAAGITADADVSVRGDGAISATVASGKTLTIRGGKHESVAFDGAGSVVVAGGSFREADVAAMSAKITSAGAYLIGPDDGWYNYTEANGAFMVLNANGTVKSLHATIHAAAQNVPENGTLRCIGAENKITIDFNGSNTNIVTLSANTCTVDLNGHTIEVVNGGNYAVFNGVNPRFVNGTILNKQGDVEGALVGNQAGVEIENVRFNFDPIFNDFHATDIKLDATCVLAGDGTYLINPATDPTDYAAKIVRHYDKNLLFNDVNHPFKGYVTYFFTGANGAANALAYAENGDTVYMNADLTVSVTTKLNAIGQTITVIKESGAENFPSADLLISSAGDFEAGTPSGNSVIYRVIEAPVCMLGSSYNNGTPKTSLSAAFTEAGGTYITLLKDITLDEDTRISPSSAVTRTLDLNGHTITFTGASYQGAFSLVNSGASNLTINATGGGTIVHANGGSVLRGAGKSTVFTINGGTFRSEGASYVVYNAKSVTVNGGTFITGSNSSNPVGAICNNTSVVALGSHTITQTGGDNGVYTYVVK